MPPVIWNSTRWSASKLSRARNWLPVAPARTLPPAWTGALIKNAGKDLSYLSVHYVVRLNRIVAKAPDADTQTAIPLALPIGMANLLKPIRAQIDADPATKGRVGLAYTEWNWGGTGPSSTNIGGAVMGAGWMNMMLSQADFVPISSMSGLMGGGGLRKSQGLVWATPQCWAFWLYSHRAGDTVVATQTEVRHYDVHDGMTSMPEIPNVPYLDVLATRNSTSGDLVLFVANRDWKNSYSGDAAASGILRRRPGTGGHAGRRLTARGEYGRPPGRDSTCDLVPGRVRKRDSVRFSQALGDGHYSEAPVMTLRPGVPNPGPGMPGPYLKRIVMRFSRPP